MVTFVGFRGDVPDEKRLIARIRRWRGRDHVVHVGFDPTCRLRDVRVVAEFPNVHRVSIRSRVIVDLNDLKRLGQLDTLSVATHRSSRRNLCVLKDLALKTLALTIQKAADIEELALVKPLQTLKVVKWPGEI